MGNDKLRKVEIVGSGAAVPENSVKSTIIDKEQGCEAGYTESRTGVYSRHFVTTESASDLAIRAIEKALIAANLSINDIDCLIAASGTMEQAIPYNASRIHSKLNFSLPIPSFDINMTCLSFLKALDIAALMINSEQHQTILIVSSDIPSSGINRADPETGGLFGDGAAAVIVTKSQQGNSGLHCFNFETHSEGVTYCQIKGGGSLNSPSKTPGDYAPFGYFEMQGKNVFRLTARVIEGFIKTTLDMSGLTLKDIDWVVPHQASKLALEHVQKQLNLDPDKVVNILKTKGNQVAASIPSALDALLRSGKTKKGDKVLFIGTSAGVSLGAAVLEL